MSRVVERGRVAEWSGRGAHVDAVEQHRGGCEVAQADEDLRLPTRRSHHMNDRTFDRVSIEFHNIVKDDQTTVRHGQHSDRDHEGFHS